MNRMRNTRIEIYNGDCLDYLKMLSDNSVDLVLTDYPCTLVDGKWEPDVPFDEFWNEINRIVRYRHPIVIFCEEPFATQLRMSNFSNYKYDWIWDKQTTKGFLNAKKKPLRRYENVCVFANGTPLYFPIIEEKKVEKKNSYSKNYKHHKYKTKKAYPTNILTFYDEFYNKRHPNSDKPVKLLEYLIKTYTKQGERVLDCFMGGGSSAIASYNLYRSYVGIEKDTQTYQSANDWLDDHISDVIEQYRANKEKYLAHMREKELEHEELKEID